jgi:predicted Zn-dependent peptidase
MDAFTAKEYAAFHIKVLDERLALAAEILGDIVRNPLLAAEDVVKEKKVIFEEINMVEDTPDDLVMELFSEAFWPRHPLGRPILGNKESVAAFSRDDLAMYFREVYRPANIVIAAAGHLEHGGVARLAREHFGSLAPGSAPTNGAPPEPGFGIVTRSKRELEQIHICLGSRAYPQTHDDRYGSFVLNTVLGGSMSSRLFQNIREKRGLAYSISSGVTSYSDAGCLGVYAGTSRESVDEVVRLTVEELKRLKSERVTAEELQRAKDHLRGSLMLALENTGSRMSHLARQEIYFGRQLGVDQMLDAIQAVSSDDVERIAAELFSGGLAMSVLGNLEGYRVAAGALEL